MVPRDTEGGCCRPLLLFAFAPQGWAGTGSDVCGILKCWWEGKDRPPLI